MSDQSNQLPELVALYRRAFADYGCRALWNMRRLDDPTPADALVIARPLRIYGGMDGRRLAERIETLCNAAQ
jgi:predicted Zn-dependent protease with MMP-like domain